MNKAIPAKVTTICPADIYVFLTPHSFFAISQNLSLLLKFLWRCIGQSWYLA